MIKVNNKYQITSDKYQWVLNEITPCKDKHGNPSTKLVPSYHASLEQVCSAILNREAKAVKDIDELKVLLRTSNTMLVQKILEEIDE